MAATQPISIVLLDEAADARVMVMPKSRDQFFLSLGEAVTACRSFVEGAKDFGAQMSDLLELLANWIEARKDRIKAAYLTLRCDNSVLFVVTQKVLEFDERLSSELTELDISIATNEAFQLICFDVLAIPAVSRESAEAFLSSGKVLTHAQ